jgi:hypothetical protein
MADQSDRSLDGDASEKEPDFTDQLSRRYDPSRLRRVVIEGVGRAEKLDEATRIKMERLLGGRFSDVRVVRGPLAEEVTRRYRADAVTVAATGLILVRDSGPRANPQTPRGQALLAHELTHVRQAQEGLHFALEGSWSSGAAHEREAEEVERQLLAEAEDDMKDAREAAAERGRQVLEKIWKLLEEEERLSFDRLGQNR